MVLKYSISKYIKKYNALDKIICLKDNGESMSKYKQWCLTHFLKIITFCFPVLGSFPLAFSERKSK